MHLPPRLRRFLRKIAQYAGPIGTSTVLRGCPCPAPVVHAPVPYTASLQFDSTMTLDATPSSWDAYCTDSCHEASSECYVRVWTSENNSLPVAAACDQQNYLQAKVPTSAKPWVDLCTQSCGEEQDCLIGPDRTQNNKVMINCVSWWLNCAGGRSTEGITVAHVPSGASVFGEWLARLATLEAESIPAFRRLAHELAALGAPRSLRRRAARSRQDEARHTRTMTSLARRHGGVPANVVGNEKRLPLRTLEEMALENAIEGCIRETRGASNAYEQAVCARDPEVRGIMRRIANDEMRHAALAWDIHAWAMKRLGVEQRARIARSMQEVARELMTRG